MIEVADTVEVATLERSGVVESRYLGAAVLVDAGGRRLDALGDPRALIYPRSAAKMFQATAVLETGVDLASEQIALATASHWGTPAHLTVVEQMLVDAGLTESALQCPADWPQDPAARHAARAPRRLAMNCSGKHAGFLGACVHAGWSTDDYLAPDHPLQRAVGAVIERLAGERVAHWGIDGCNAPTPVVTLEGLARGFAALVAGDSPIPAAMRAHPWAIDGPGRPNAVTIEKAGVLAKTGAEGVLLLAAPTGESVAVKILDGSGRAATLVALRLLVRAGLVDDAAADAVLAAVVDPALRVAF